MFTTTDFDKLQQIMDESPEKKELIQKLLDTHQTTLHTINHEIRNPLTLIYSTVQLIESQHPEVTDYKHWQTLRSDIEYILSLLRQLSSYNKEETLSLSTFQCSAFLRPLALSFAASLEETDIEFTSKIDADLPEITADAIKLKEVLLNLLQNARDAVAPSGSIYLSAQVKDNFLQISVTDNGCGIPEDTLEEIFEPFVTHKPEGTGLGLAISRKIAQAHGGSLTAISSPGESTTFTLSLPIEKDAQHKA